MKKWSVSAKGRSAFLPDLDDDRLTFSSDDDSANELTEARGDTTSLKISEDSDSCPEEVTFKTGEEENKLSRKRTAEQIKRQNVLIKKKRSEIHLRNLKQKEEKQKKLGVKKLPDALLAEIESLSVNETQSPETMKPVPDDKHVSLSDDTDIADTQKANEYVVGKTKFQVKNLKEAQTSNPVYAGLIDTDIVEYRKMRRYQRRVRRELSSRSYFAKLEKQRARFGNR